MDEVKKTYAGETAPEPARKPLLKVAIRRPVPKPPPKKPVRKKGLGKIKAIISMREGEHGPAARLEFQHNDHPYAILEATEPKEQKKYRFRYFNNILVAGRYSEDLEEFLQKGAREAGFELELVNDGKKKAKKMAPKLPAEPETKEKPEKPEAEKKPTPAAIRKSEAKKLVQPPKTPAKKPVPKTPPAKK